MNTEKQKGYYTIGEAADLLCVSRTLIYNLMRNGQIGYIVVGGSRRISREHMDAFVRNATVTPKK